MTRPDLAHGTPELETLLEGARRVLDVIAGRAPLAETFAALVDLVEDVAGDMRCAILLKDGNEPRLRFVAAQNLPEGYVQAIAPFLEVEPGKEPGETFPFWRQPAYTYDTGTDTAGKQFGAIAAEHGLRASWFTPILSGDDETLGVFAMYYGEPRLPTEKHIRLIRMATQIARLAIDSVRDDQLWNLPLRAGRRVIVTDLRGRIVQLDEAFAELLGYAAADLRGRHISIVAPDGNHDELMSTLLSPHDPDGRRIRLYRARDGRTFSLTERWSLLRDADHRARFAYSQIMSAVEAAKHPLCQLSERERQVLELVVAGQTNRQIGARLGISAASVATYRSRIMIKLGIAHTAGLVRFAIENGVQRSAA